MLCTIGVGSMSIGDFISVFVSAISYSNPIYQYGYGGGDRMIE